MLRQVPAGTAIMPGYKAAADGKIPSAAVSRYCSAPFWAARFFILPSLIPRAAVRQRQGEDAALAGEAFRRDARAVEVGDLFDQREPEAQAAA